MRENSVQIRRNLLKAEIIVLVAMGATHRIEMLPFGLLWRERGLAVTTDEGRDCAYVESEGRACDLGHFLQSH
jgi:hypothetical protein